LPQPGFGFLPVDVGEGFEPVVAVVQEGEQGAGEGLLGAVEGRQVDGGDVGVAGGDLFAYHSPVAAVVVVGGQLVEAGGGERGGHVEDFDGVGGEVGGGQVAVAVVGGLGQGVAQAGFDAFGAVVRDADGLGDGVGGLEADPPHVVGQAVGLGADDFDAAFAVLLEDAHRDGGGHADALQEDHHFFDDFLFFPGVGDHAGAFGAEAGDFGEAFGVVFDDVEGAGAEVVDDAFG